MIALYMWNLKYDANELIYDANELIQNRNRLTNIKRQSYGYQRGSREVIN